MEAYCYLLRHPKLCVEPVFGEGPTPHAPHFPGGHPAPQPGAVLLEIDLHIHGGPHPHQVHASFLPAAGALGREGEQWRSLRHPVQLLLEHPQRSNRAYLRERDVRCPRNLRTVQRRHENYPGSAQRPLRLVRHNVRERGPGIRKNDPEQLLHGDLVLLLPLDPPLLRDNLEEEGTPHHPEARKGRLLPLLPEDGD